MPQWEKIALIGVGLLGGSIGLAARKRSLARRVEGYVRRPASIPECTQTGAVDEAKLDLESVVAGADLIVFCTPIAQMASLASRMLPSLTPGTLVTDVGSVKGPVVSELEPLLARARAHFIGSHPMAGAEKMGVTYASPTLFQGATCVITPTPHTSPTHLARLERFWEAVGAHPLRLSADLHDDLVSRSSHLPHVVASELANYVLSPAHAREQALLCANGFRDTTRIASGSPEMWRDISLANRRNLARVLGVFIEDLQEFQLALERQDVPAIEEFFKQAKERRDAWQAHARSSPSPE